jgi:hypothetical protein
MSRDFSWHIYECVCTRMTLMEMRDGSLGEGDVFLSRHLLLFISIFQCSTGQRFNIFPSAGALACSGSPCSTGSYGNAGKALLACDQPESSEVHSQRFTFTAQAPISDGECTQIPIWDCAHAPIFRLGLLTLFQRVRVPICNCFNLRNQLVVHPIR